MRVSLYLLNLSAISKSFRQIDVVSRLDEQHSDKVDIGREVPRERERIETIHCLRGVASFAVCWFHLTNGNTGFLASGPLKLSGAYGWLGVEIFFVISGFILPWAMFSAGYKLNLKNYTMFLLKRVLRLDPPYLAAVIVSIVLAYVSFWLPGYRGNPPDIGLPRVLAHMAYLNAFFKYEWLNPVFWSLAIEFQYYLLIGLALPLITSRAAVVRLLGGVTLASLSILPAGEAFLSHYIFLFLMGILVFQYRIKRMPTPEALLFLGIAAVGAWANLGVLISAAGLGTSLAIMFLQWRNSILGWLGNISYSLYLVHVPLGGRIINLAARFERNESMKLISVAVALAASLVAAYGMFRFVESPSQKWAKSIRFRSEEVVLCR